MNGSQKALEAERLQSAISSVLAIHRQTFTPVEAPTAPEPVLPDFRDILKAAEKQALQPVPLTAIQQRRLARSAAYEASCEHAAGLLREAAQLRSSYQAELDHQWTRLLANDPDVVLPTLREAFADNDAPAVPVSVHDDTISVVVVVPDVEILPERFPTTTGAGNLSVKKMTKSMRNELYLELLAGYAVVTVREAFAVAPGLGRAEALLVRRGPTGPQPFVIFETTRAALDRSHGDTAVSIASAAASALHMKTRGVAKDLQPLDLAGRADLAHFAPFLATLHL